MVALAVLVIGIVVGLVAMLTWLCVVLGNAQARAEGRLNSFAVRLQDLEQDLAKKPKATPCKPFKLSGDEWKDGIRPDGSEADGL